MVEKQDIQYHRGDGEKRRGGPTAPRNAGDAILLRPLCGELDEQEERVFIIILDLLVLKCTSWSEFSEQRTRYQTGLTHIPGPHHGTLCPQSASIPVSLCPPCGVSSNVDLERMMASSAVERIFVLRAGAAAAVVITVGIMVAVPILRIIPIRVVAQDFVHVGTSNVELACQRGFYTFFSQNISLLSCRGV